MKLSSVQIQRRNANRHTQRGMGELERSIQQDGMIGAITVAANGEIFDGSARREVIETAGLDDAIIIRSDGSRPIIHIREDIPDADDPRAIRLGIAANRVAQLNLDFDIPLLAELAAQDATLLEGLFRQDELDALLASVALPIMPGAGGDEFDTTPADGPTRTQTGDIWAMGHHRILVGDCTDPANVARLMDGAKAEMIITSPPYWVGKTYEQETSWAEIQAFILRATAAYVPAVNPQGRIIINTGTCQAGRWFKGVAQMRLLLDDWQRAFESYGWPMRYVRCWAKRGQLPMVAPSMDVIDVHWEMLGYFYNPTAKPFKGSRRTGEPWATDGIWEFHGERSAGGTHEAAFPIELPTRNILLFSDKDDIILDPFLGSGTTLIAAQRTGRTCYGLEIAPTYADVILRRWEAEAGQVAQKVEA